MKRLLSLLAIPSLALGGAMAETLLRDDFSSYSAGERPLLPPNGSYHAWRYDDAWLAEVRRENARSYLHLQRPAGLPYSTFSIGFDPGEETQKNLAIQTALRFGDSDEPSDYFLILGHFETSPHSGPVKIRICNRRLSVYHGSEGTSTTMPSELKPNVWYTLRIIADYSSQHYSVGLQQEGSTSEVFSLQAVPFVMQASVPNYFLIRPAESRDPQRGALEWEMTDFLIESENQ